MPDLQLGGCRFESRPGLLCTKVYSAFHPSGVGKWVAAAAGRQRQVWLIPIVDARVGVQVKLKSLENTCHTWTLLRWWFTTKRRLVFGPFTFTCNTWKFISSFLFFFKQKTLGTSKRKLSWHVHMISMLLVWNSFIKNLFILKSSDDNWDLNKSTSLQTIQQHWHTFTNNQLQCHLLRGQSAYVSLAAR